MRNLKRLSEEYTTQNQTNEDGSCKNLLPPQLCSSNWQNELESLILRTETTIRHFKCLWDSCPSQLPSQFEPIALVSEDANGIANELNSITRGDEKWNQVDQRISDCLRKLKEIKEILRSQPAEKAILGK